MYSSLDDVEFLVGSANRIDVLKAIYDAPRAPHELRQLTGASRITIARILDDLERRGWASQENGQYDLTARGAVVTGEFSRLLASLDAVSALGEAISWLPIEEFNFDLGHLIDAKVRHTESWKAHTETVRQTSESVAGAAEIWGTAIGFSHEVVNALRDATVEGGASFDLVIDSPTFELVRSDPGMRRCFGEIMAAEGTSITLYNGKAPLHMVMVMDETVSICGHVDQGVPPGMIETNDETVRAWARSYFESAWAGSKPIEPSALAGDPAFTA